MEIPCSFFQLMLPSLYPLGCLSVGFVLFVLTCSCLCAWWHHSLLWQGMVCEDEVGSQCIERLGLPDGLIMTPCSLKNTEVPSG